MLRFWRKYHKYLGIIVTFFIVTFSLSGILLNHREQIASIDIDRDYLTSEHHYHNWNKAAIKGAVHYREDSILVYGNTGIWLCDSLYQQFSPFCQGLPQGIDHRKINSLYKTRSGDLYAGSFWGLYHWQNQQWHKIQLPVKAQRIVDIGEKDGRLLVLTRSFLLTETAPQQFKIVQLPAPHNYQNTVSLFKTVWLLHSGEILGIGGQLLVDIMALVLIFLSITGLILFLKRKQKKKHKKVYKWNIKWHNKIGWTTFILASFVTLTGMFLRPPLLIAIFNKEVGKIPFSQLDSPNPWYDQLRAFVYDETAQRYIFGTNKGFYSSDTTLKEALHYMAHQPPISIMGINVLQKIDTNKYLVGSFAGIFEWQPNKKRITNRVTRLPYREQESMIPLGNEMISGYIADYKGQEIFFDYSKGAYSTFGKKAFADMPQNVKDSPMSLWHLALEVHTGRIFSSLMGNFFILVVPLSGIMILFVLISGFVIWFRKYRGKVKVKS